MENERRMTTWNDQARVPGTLSCILLFFVIAGCADGSNRAAGPGTTTVRDSAGVRIVTSEKPLWGAGAGWTVIPEPSVTIGTGDVMGDDGTDMLFGSIRSVAVLASGRLAVADEHSAVVWVFDPGGRLVHHFGGRGEGPGELGGIWNLYSCADDTVIARFRNELSLFGGDGEFIRRINSSGAGTTWGLQATAHDCRQFIASRSADATIPPVGQEWLSRRVLVRTDDAFVVSDTIGWEVAGERYTGWLEGDEMGVTLPWHLRRPRPVHYQA